MEGRDYLVIGAFILLVTLVLGFLSLNSGIREDGHMRLLAVSETNNGSLSGNVADLYVQIRPGSGRVFIDTYPVTKLDTQLSTRFAKELACSFAEVDCSRLDFFYTIRSSSPTIGGPSAGAAIASLTIAMLDGLPIRDDVLITGTINSGGIIGPVGGLAQKIDAASSVNASKVLVSSGSVLIRQNDSDNHSSLNLTLYAEELGVELVEIGDLRDAMFELTGVFSDPITGEAIADSSYSDTMIRIASDLCNRSKMLEAVLLENSSPAIVGRNLSALAQNEIDSGNYYSAASRCFGANIRFKQAWYDEQSFSEAGYNSEFDTVIIYEQRVRSALLDVKLSTVSDLQTYIIVDERLAESKDYLERAKDSLLENDTDSANYFLAYAYERVNSATSWSKFFGTEGTELELDKEALSLACHEKLSESEQRMQYVMSFYPLRLSDTRRELDKAYADSNNGDYELCLFRASKAKAELDVLMSVVGVSDDAVPGLLNQKLGIAGKTISEQIAKGNFPILGYSYYEYAKALAGTDKYSALIYAEYAMELSNLDAYLNRPENEVPLFRIDPELLLMLSVGVFVGMLGGLLLARKHD